MGRRAKAGFALPSVLFVVAMVTLVFLVAIEALASLAVETRRARDGARFEADAKTLEARIAFLAATHPLGAAAILRDGQPGAPGVLGLDGRPYEAAPGLSAEVQDEAGLINLDNLPVGAVPRLFAVLGVPPGWQAAMADRFEDYLDPTDVKRPQGADTEDYFHAGLPPPAKHPLIRRDQLEGVMGWHALVSAPAWRAFEANVTADPGSADVNVNTATPGMMEVVYGLSPAQAQLALAVRSQAPFSELEDLGRAAGVSGLHSDLERPDTVPNGHFALRIADARAQQGYRARLLLSPDDPSRPFYVEEAAAASLTPAETAALPAHAPQLP